MPSEANYYDLLELSPDATPEEIKHAFREAARRVHPDVNSDRQSTELFLQIQKAYNVLGNPQERKEYDRLLAESNRDTLQVSIIYGAPTLAILEEPQIAYVLLSLTAGKHYAPPTDQRINLGLVLDRSTSMQGARMDMVKDAAIDMLKQLGPLDQITVVSFSDRADVLASAGKKIDRRLIENQIQMIRPGGGTEMFQGLSAAHAEVQRMASRAQTNHLILITDGRTYGDELACLRLAERCAQQGIQITAMGIGTDWNDQFIDQLTGITGGSSYYVSQSTNLRQLLKDKLQKLKEVFADQISLDFAFSTEVKLVSAYRVAPEPIVIPTENSLHLGYLPYNSGLTVLFEFYIGAITPITTRYSLGDLEIQFSLPANPEGVIKQPLRLTRPVSAEPFLDLPPAPIFKALTKLNLYRMQERARQEMLAGKTEEAEACLKRLAAELLNRGETALANMALLEAHHIRETQAISAEAVKQIKYGTRSLFLPAGFPVGDA